ncbi:MAG: DUF3047 domain-containing protein [Gemmatimonadetes bacterium]|nr:DUF3047 domain-containing protein [Gemmatimonadota bacterium]
MVLRLCVLVVFVIDLRYSICFAAGPDSTVVQPVVSVSVDSTVVDSLLSTDPAMNDPSRSDLDPSTTLEITDPTQPPAHWITPAGDSTHVLDAFDYPRFLNTFPDNIWQGRSGLLYRKTKKSDVYYRILEEDNNHYLNAKTKGSAVNFGREAKVTFRGREINISLRSFRNLRWRWRVHQLPEGSDETDGDKNDSAAAVRLVIGASKWNPRAAKSLKYIWSETLPKGTVISSSRQHMIVLRSGTDDLGKWVWEEVDAYQDYRRLFGGDPRPVDVLALLTDSNNTGTVVAADYDDITFIIPRPTVEMNPEDTE